MARQAEGRLSREAVAEGALALADAEGLEAVTIRRLAQDLGVTPRALYWHLKNQEGLPAAQLPSMPRPGGRPAHQLRRSRRLLRLRRRLLHGRSRRAQRGALRVVAGATRRSGRAGRPAGRGGGGSGRVAARPTWPACS